jgi:hypothetical protein
LPLLTRTVQQSSPIHPGLSMLSTQITHANDNAFCSWRGLGAPAALPGRPAPDLATEIARTRWPARGILKHSCSRWKSRARKHDPYLSRHGRPDLVSGGMARSPRHFRENLGKPLPESPDFGRGSRRPATKSGRSRSAERTRRIILQPSACAWSKIPSPRDSAPWPKRMRIRSHHDRRPHPRLPVCLVRSAVCPVRNAVCPVRSHPACPVRKKRVPGPKPPCAWSEVVPCAWSERSVCLVPRNRVPGPKEACAWSQEIVCLVRNRDFLSDLPAWTCEKKVVLALFILY